MELEKQVVSLELAKKLKELGVRQESYFWWTDYGVPHVITAESGKSIFYEHTQKRRCYAAFTVAELGEMLKDSDYYLPYSEGDWTIWECRVGNTPDGEKQYLTAKTEADARAKMLIYLIENKLVDPISSNER